MKEEMIKQGTDKQGSSKKEERKEANLEHEAIGVRGRDKSECVDHIVILRALPHSAHRELAHQVLRLLQRRV